MKALHRVAWTFAGALLACGCGGDGGSNAGVQAPPVAADRWPAPSNEECTAYARRLEAAVLAGPAAVNALIEWDVLLKKVTSGIDVAEEFVRGFIRGAKKSRDTAGGLSGQIIAAVRAGGSYRFLRVREREDGKRVLFRLTLPNDAGFNYHELILAKCPDGQVKALDIYVYVSGEKISTTLRRVYLPMAAKQARGLLARLATRESDFVTHFPTLIRMANDVRAGEYERVLDAYGSLPASLQKEKVFLLLRVQAAMHVDDDAYAAAIDAFRKTHPDDACIDLVSIDGYVIKKQYGKALACLDRLDASLGGDPELNLLRASAYVEQGKYADARRVTQSVIDAQPDDSPAYWTMFNIAVREKDYRDAVDRARQIQDKFDEEFADLTTIPEYAEFAKSPEYREWIRSKGN